MLKTTLKKYVYNESSDYWFENYCINYIPCDHCNDKLSTKESIVLVRDADDYGRYKSNEFFCTDYCHQLYKLKE